MAYQQSPQVDDSSVVGRVVSRFEVVQHALGLSQHKVALLPLESVSKGNILSPTVLSYSLFQVTCLQLACGSMYELADDIICL